MKLKRFCAWLLCFWEAFFCCFVVNAQNPASPSSNTELVECNGYYFAISTEETSAHQVVKHYDRSTENTRNTKTARSPDLSETEALLLAMGWDQQMVDNLTYEALQEYATCEQITTTVSYARISEQGDAEYISQQEALSEAATYVERPEEVSKVTNKTYIRLTHTATYFGNALYRFSTDAVWLTMPLWQQPDSIGSCASQIAIDNDTRAGQIIYVKEYTNNITGEAYTQTFTQDITQFKNAINGNWYGSVGIFSFPYCGVYDDITVACISLRAHYEFKAYVYQPELAANFNSVGTYWHTEGFHGLNTSISISFGFDDIVSATIGFDPQIDNDPISAELLIHYTPD